MMIAWVRTHPAGETFGRDTFCTGVLPEAALWKQAYSSHLFIPPWLKQASCLFFVKLNVPSLHSAVAPPGIAFELAERCVLCPKKLKKAGNGWPPI
jgi:hypothetical protein